EKMLAELDHRIEQLLEEGERIDQQEEGLGSSVAVDQEWVQAEGLKKKIQQALEALEKSGQEKLNLTDPDCAVMHSVQGRHASYNVQSVVDDNHRLLEHTGAASGNR